MQLLLFWCSLLGEGVWLLYVIPLAPFDSSIEIGISGSLISSVKRIGLLTTWQVKGLRPLFLQLWFRQHLIEDSHLSQDGLIGLSQLSISV